MGCSTSLRFSEYFSITRTDEDDWFDPHLSVDTRLFIDPLLLLDAGGRWKAAHEKLIDYFVTCYELVAKGGSPQSPPAKAVIRLLTFPEPSEFRLGYTSLGTKGAGSGRGYAKAIRDGIAVAIAKGLERPEHIEEIGILNEGIGADRISDIVANVLKDEFAEYTREIAQRHGIPLRSFEIPAFKLNTDYQRWHLGYADLPAAPDGSPIVLVPTRILNELPTLNPNNWFDMAMNEDLRESLNLKVGQTASKAMIVEFARRHPDRVRQWAREQTSRPDLRHYDFEGDPLGVVKWDREPKHFALNHPLPIQRVETQDQLMILLDQIIAQFKLFIEQRGGWSLLWNEDRTVKREEAIQLAFLGLAGQYLRQFDVELDREVDLGRGPVDFKVSRGTCIRALIEVKKVENGRFWNGLHKQLPSYLESDSSGYGWFIAVQFNDTKTSCDRVQQLPNEVKGMTANLGKNIRFTVIDARPPKSASKITE